MSHPPCLGWYDRGDAICEGDARAKGDASGPCSYRDRCVAFNRLLHLTGKDGEPSERERFLVIDEDDARPRHPQKFDEVLDRIVLRYGIRNGVETKSGKPPGSRRKGRRKPAGREVVKRPSTRERSKELASFFLSKIVESTEVEVHDLPGKADPGEFFLVDRMERSGYVSLYARGFRRYRVPLVRVVPNRRDGSLQLRIAADFETFVALAPRKSKLEAIDCTGSDGKFNAKFVGLDRESSSIVAEMVARALDEGVIDLEGTEE